jgi:hypothetical protein
MDAEQTLRCTRSSLVEDAIEKKSYEEYAANLERLRTRGTTTAHLLESDGSCLEMKTPDVRVSKSAYSPLWAAPMSANRHW